MLRVDAVLCLAGLLDLVAFRDIPEHLCDLAQHINTVVALVDIHKPGWPPCLRQGSGPEPAIVTLNTIHVRLDLTEPFAGYVF